MAKTWVEIKVLAQEADEAPGLRLRLRFWPPAPEVVQRLKALVPARRRSYDDETHYWYVHESYGEALRGWALQWFQDASHIDGNVIEDLHTGQRIVQGDLFEGGRSDA